MAKSNSTSTSFFNPEFFKAFSSMPNMPLDTNAFMEVQRKNFQAFSEAQQMAMESLQAIAQRQTEILSQIVEENSNIAKEALSEHTPEQKVAKQTDLIQKSYEKSIENAREIADMVSRSSTEASEIINKRISASLKEIKTAMEDAEKTSKKAA